MGLRYGYLTLIFSLLLGCHEGFVALWNPPDPDPVVVFPYHACALPPEDFRLLQEGIEITGRRELTLWLEDHLS